MPWLAALIAAAAGVHFILGLGDSSYFVDEAFSIRAALPSLTMHVVLVEPIG